MKKSSSLNAIDSLLEKVKLNENEIEEIYRLLGDNEITTFVNELQEFGETLPKNADEFDLLNLLKNLDQNSPKTYETLQKMIRENKQLFDKIQDIFIEKII